MTNVLQESNPANEDAELSSWLVEQSFRKIKPFCRGVGIIVLIAALLFDPYAYFSGLWVTFKNFVYLLYWHVITIVTLLVFYLICDRPISRSKMKSVVYIFLACTGVLYTWMGYINVTDLHDLSIFALATTFIATYFPLHGILRFLIYAISAAVLLLTIILNMPPDSSAGLIINLFSVMAFAYLLDRHTLKQHEKLFHEKKNVERERARADEVLYNVLPESIANELKTEKIVKAQKYDALTIIFADIVGFTQFSRNVPPDALIFVLNQIFSLFDELVEKAGVEKIKTIGDAYMIVAYEKTEEAADLAIAMQAALNDYNRHNGVEFQLRVGMHQGPAVAGVIGIKRFLYDVWGDAVNTASRMESSGSPGRIQVTEAIRNTLVNSHTFEDRGEQEIKGKGLMNTYFLIGRK